MCYFEMVSGGKKKKLVEHRIIVSASDSGNIINLEQERI